MDMEAITMEWDKGSQPPPGRDVVSDVGELWHS